MIGTYNIHCKIFHNDLKILKLQILCSIQPSYNIHSTNFRKQISHTLCMFLFGKFCLIFLQETKINKMRGFE